MDPQQNGIRVCIHNPSTSIRITPLEPGDPGYRPESEAFVKAVMESEAGDEFDVALKRKLKELADKWESFYKGGESQAKQ